MSGLTDSMKPGQGAIEIEPGTWCYTERIAGDDEPTFVIWEGNQRVYLTSLGADGLFKLIYPPNTVAV